MFSILIGSIMMISFLVVGFLLGMGITIAAAKSYLQQGKTLEDFVSTKKNKSKKC